MKKKDLNKRNKELEERNKELERKLAKKEKSLWELLIKKGFKLLRWIIVLLWFFF